MMSRPPLAASIADGRPLVCTATPTRAIQLRSFKVALTTSRPVRVTVSYLLLLLTISISNLRAFDLEGGGGLNSHVRKRAAVYEFEFRVFPVPNGSPVIRLACS